MKNDESIRAAAGKHLAKNSISIQEQDYQAKPTEELR